MASNDIPCFIAGIAIGLLGYFFLYLPLNSWVKNFKSVQEAKIHKHIFASHFSQMSDEDLQTIEGLRTLMRVQAIAETATIHRYHKEILLKEISGTFRCVSHDLKDKFGENYLNFVLKNATENKEK